MKYKIRKMLKNLLIILSASLVCSGIGYGISIAISSRYGYSLQDVLSYVGIILFILGLLMSMKGSPNGMSISKIGSKDENITSYLNNEITSQDRRTNPYYKDYFRNNIVTVSISNLTFLISGALILLSTVIFFK